ncbi:hypothetical protein FHS29_005258 [Saccharothrix tamanrassetensis]|uniref:Secreted protein n=1 Tax=Saccharothrix tamanrassetensis TaxID=1051531 RepID=A0A841CND2_9PSEU|nr:hypothetical protein [Saccharothrix tamanrassetensis]MBB5958650.1 hypothetical protein [Saccharothrix tamanrassetensis]
MKRQRMTSAVVAVGAALAVIVTTSGTASAAKGTFVIGDTAVLTDPQDETCYPIEIKKGKTIYNRTDRSAKMYKDQDCTTYVFDIGRKGKTGQSSIDAKWSVKFRKSG